jgi:hypothetical protein
VVRPIDFDEGCTSNDAATAPVVDATVAAATAEAAPVKNERRVVGLSAPSSRAVPSEYFSGEVFEIGRNIFSSVILLSYKVVSLSSTEATFAY